MLTLKDLTAEELYNYIKKQENIDIHPEQIEDFLNKKRVVNDNFRKNMRILHISDFHLSNDDANIAKSQKIVDGLIEAVKTANEEYPIDLVIFSGDAINKGGEGFASLNDGFLSFQTRSASSSKRSSP